MSSQRTFSVEVAHWVRGVRFYIASATILITAEVWWWVSVSYSGSVLFATRLEEVYAWLATGLLALALAIGPIYKVFPKLPVKFIMYDARRLFGVSAAWFATLHVAIVYVSLFKLANPLSLPVTYKRSFLVGIIALVILLAMAFTSFDKAFRGMGIWWYRLHRLVYAAALLTLLHSFMIGAHATNWPALLLLAAASLTILALQVYAAFNHGRRPTVWQLVTITLTTILLIATLNYGYSQQKLNSDSLKGQQHQL